MYRQQLDDGSWTEWSESCVEVGDRVVVAETYCEFSITAIVTRVTELSVFYRRSDGVNIVLHKNSIQSIVTKGGDPRRHPRFVPMTPQFPATKDGRKACREWAKTATGFEVMCGWLGFDFANTFVYDGDFENYRIRAIGSELNYPLFVEVK